MVLLVTVCFVALGLVWTGMASKNVPPPCDQQMFDSNVENCLSAFNYSMRTSGYQDRCPWPTVKGIYNQLSLCVDDWAITSWCRGKAFLLDEVFSPVHQAYFSHCGQIQDPPTTILAILISPCIIFTLLVPFLCFHPTTPRLTCCRSDERS